MKLHGNAILNSRKFYVISWKDTGNAQIPSSIKSWENLMELFLFKKLLASNTVFHLAICDLYVYIYIYVWFK